jgi:ketosteroid isomerase-like protein
MGLHRYVGLLAISLIIALPASAAETSSNAEQEVKAAIDKHVKALNDKDLKAVMATICPSPTAVSMGNSPEQTRVGTEQIAAHYGRLFAEAPVNIRITEIVLGVSDTVGWFAANCQVTTLGAKGKEMSPVNWSGVLEKRDGKWLMVLSHYSFPVKQEVYRKDL